MFGFGSLINSRSRARTLGEVPAWPVRVSGLRRGWLAPSSRAYTALGVRLDADASCNGVVALLPAERVAALDARESGYRRTLLPRSRVSALEHPPPDGTIVTYVPRAPRLPDVARPIIRSYIDVTLSGCLEYGEPFARELLETTDGWNGHIEDERHAPRYPLHEAHAPRALLDALVQRVLGPAQADASTPIAAQHR